MSAMTATSGSVPDGRYADSKLPTFVLAMYLNQRPLSAEQDLLFVRYLSHAMNYLAEAAVHQSRLQELRELIWWNLAPVAPFSIWAFVIQELCASIVLLLGKRPSSIFTAKHPITRDHRLPKWQYHPAWTQFLSASRQNITHDQYLSALIVEYAICVGAALRILEAFVKQDFGIDTRSTGNAAAHTGPLASASRKVGSLSNNKFHFGDPRVTTINSPGIFVFEACASVVEVSHALEERYPWLSEKLQEFIAHTLTVTGIVDTYSERLKAVIDRAENIGMEVPTKAASKLRATAKEFTPAVREGHQSSLASHSASVAHAPLATPRRYSGSRPAALHIDDFEAIYGEGLWEGLSHS